MKPVVMKKQRTVISRLRWFWRRGADLVMRDLTATSAAICQPCSGDSSGITEEGSLSVIKIVHFILQNIICQVSMFNLGNLLCPKKLWSWYDLTCALHEKTRYMYLFVFCHVYPDETLVCLGVQQIKVITCCI